MLPSSPALQGGAEGSFIKIAIFLTGLRSTAVRQNPHPLGWRASLMQKTFVSSSIFNFSISYGILEPISKTI